MKDPLANYPGYLLRRAAHASGSELAVRLEPLGLRQSDVSMLILIKANPGITASALGRMLDIQRANMVPILKRMEDADLIVREAIDGKSVGLELTANGAARLADAQAVIDTFEAELVESVPAEHRDHLLPALAALWQRWTR